MLRFVNGGANRPAFSHLSSLSFHMDHGHFAQSIQNKGNADRDSTIDCALAEGVLIDIKCGLVNESYSGTPWQFGMNPRKGDPDLRCCISMDSEMVLRP
jgi:hypothetical protein